MVPHTEIALARKHFRELRDTWQVRALVQSKNEHVGFVLLSVLGDAYGDPRDDRLALFLKVAFPGFKGINPPALCSSGKIGKSGQIVADVAYKHGRVRNVVLYASETALRDDFRRLADQLKLNDFDRIEMFKCVQKWVVADTRLDPTFDPQDPDAKRLVH